MDYESLETQFFQEKINKAKLRVKYDMLKTKSKLLEETVDNMKAERIALETCFEIRKNEFALKISKLEKDLQLAKSVTNNFENKSKNFKGFSTDKLTAKKFQKPVKPSFTCHYCRETGHIRSNCFKLINQYFKQIKASKSFSNKSNILKNSKIKKTYLTWVKKSSKCLTANTDLKEFPFSPWYMDSGCSRHCTGDITVFSKIEPFDGGTTVYGDGKEGKITGKGTVTMVDMPEFHNCRYIENQKSNLLSVSQFCDDKCIVMFTKNECSVWNSTGNCIIKAHRTPSDLYAVISNSEFKETCMTKRKTGKSEKSVSSCERKTLRAHDRELSKSQYLPSKDGKDDKFPRQVSSAQKGKIEHKPNSFNSIKPYENWHLWDEFGDISSKCKFKLKDKNISKIDCVNKNSLTNIPFKNRYSEKGNELVITCHYCDRKGHSISNCFELTKKTQGTKPDISARTNITKYAFNAGNKNPLMLKRERKAMRIHRKVDHIVCA